MKILLLFLLFAVSLSLYNQTPVYTFRAVDQSVYTQFPDSMFLAQQQDKLIVSYYPPNQPKAYKIFNFKGQLQCQKQHTVQKQSLAGWPSKSGIIFRAHEDTKNILTRSTSDCETVQNFVNNASQIYSVDYALTSSFSIIGVQTNDLQITEYDLQSKAIQKVYKVDKLIGHFAYSPNGKYLYVMLIDPKDQNQKWTVIVFDRSSGEKVNQIVTPFELGYPFYDGEGFLGWNANKVGESRKYYHINRNGQYKKLFQLSDQDRTKIVAMTTSDNLFVTIKYSSGNQTTLTTTLVAYNTEDGSIAQQFLIDLGKVTMNDWIIFSARQKELGFLRKDGIMSIYSYESELKEQSEFPVWAIVLIAVGSLVIVGGTGVGVYNYRKKTVEKGKSSILLDEQEKSRNEV